MITGAVWSRDSENKHCKDTRHDRVPPYKIRTAQSSKKPEVLVLKGWPAGVGKWSTLMDLGLSLGASLLVRKEGSWNCFIKESLQNSCETRVGQ